jgi:hypothetical protein
VIFHYRRTTNTPEESLLHSTLEANNGDFWRWLCFILWIKKVSDKSNRAGLTNSISTGTSRTHNQGMITLMERLSMRGGQGTEAYSQRRHAHCKPEILLAEDVLSAQVPGPGVGIVRVSEDGEDP